MNPLKFISGTNIERLTNGCIKSQRWRDLRRKQYKPNKKEQEVIKKIEKTLIKLKGELNELYN